LEKVMSTGPRRYPLPVTGAGGRANSATGDNALILQRAHLPELIEALRRRGHTIIGPTLGEGAIVYDELESAEDLPVGWVDEQDGGTYRLRRRSDDAVFGYAVGPQSWKRILHTPVQRLWQATRAMGEMKVVAEAPETRKYAFLGVRSCDLHAIATLDKVLLGGAFVDPFYQSRRRDLFIVAINCSHAGGTCFCVSMNTGPKVTSDFDLALTEVLSGGEHYFVVEVGSQRGEEVMADVRHERATPRETDAAERVVLDTARHMGRQMDTAGIKELLYRNYEHPRWDDVASRCLTCANCTMVCPTCFCTTVEDVTDLTGDHAERWRKWDSCFTMQFSYIVGGSVRATNRSRYRQWMTHKLATWFDQFGTSGCVGCGRCITWCPVAIDITEEVRAIRATEPAPGSGAA
jgi:ferredoxin